MNVLLHIDRICKAFGARVLFDIAPFELEAGRAYVLTGANGSGKSTLLRILAGLESATVEGLSFLGQGLKPVPYPALMRDAIAFVHQHPVMFSTTVAGNIGYGLAARGVPRAQGAQAVAAAMEWAGVTHLKDSDPARLSGGEKQRIALARAKVMQPKLLLLDEPTSNLDGAAREQVLALIPQLVASGATVVMACHDRDLISLPDVRRLKLRDGRLERRAPQRGEAPFVLITRPEKT